MPQSYLGGREVPNTVSKAVPGGRTALRQRVSGTSILIWRWMPFQSRTSAFPSNVSSLKRMARDGTTVRSCSCGNGEASGSVQHSLPPRYESGCHRPGTGTRLPSAAMEHLTSRTAIRRPWSDAHPTARRKSSSDTTSSPMRPLYPNRTDLDTTTACRLLRIRPECGWMPPHAIRPFRAITPDKMWTRYRMRHNRTSGPFGPSPPNSYNHI